MTKWLLALLVLCALSASAADVAGTWKASMDTPNGAMEITFVFKVDGANLTGTVSNPMGGDSPISEGKIDGDNVSFTVALKFNGQDFKLAYKGKVAGDEMKLSLTIPNMDQTFEFTAKRAK